MFPSWAAAVVMARTVAAVVPPAGLTPRRGGSGVSPPPPIESANPTLRLPRLLISTAADFSSGSRTGPLAKTGSFCAATVATTFAPGEFFTIGGGRRVLVVARASRRRPLSPSRRNLRALPLHPANEPCHGLTLVVGVEAMTLVDPDESKPLRRARGVVRLLQDLGGRLCARERNDRILRARDEEDRGVHETTGMIDGLLLVDPRRRRRGRARGVRPPCPWWNPARSESSRRRCMRPRRPRGALDGGRLQHREPLVDAPVMPRRRASISGTRVR